MPIGGKLENCLEAVLVVDKIELGKGVVGVDEKNKVVFVSKKAEKKFIQALSDEGYKIIYVDEFRAQ